MLFNVLNNFTESISPSSMPVKSRSSSAFELTSPDVAAIDVDDVDANGVASTAAPVVVAAAADVDDESFLSLLLSI